ncbi:MAG: mreC [Bacteroidetes bacterium]|jgi:rod shape-determining protein MreC|nr:mreC [Bacteroidota bacterium]
MYKRLFEIVQLFKEYFLLALFLVASIALLTFNENQQIRAIRSVAVASVGFLQDALSFIPNYFDLRRENKVLRELNLTLADEVSRLREGRLENIRLRQLLALKERGVYTYVSANVVGKNLQLLRNTITLDVGEQDSVAPNMPIVSESGLVGKIIATSDRYSIGQILLNRELRVSAKVQRSRVDGIIRWDGGPSLSLQNVVKTMDVKEGDHVITSDYSSVFPPGLVIGTVSSTHENPGTLFEEVEVMPAVDFTRLEEVFVITHIADSSRVDLEQHLQP